MVVDPVTKKRLAESVNIPGCRFTLASLFFTAGPLNAALAVMMAPADEQEEEQG